MTQSAMGISSPMGCLLNESTKGSWKLGFVLVPFGKQPHNYGKSSFLRGNLTISMAIFSSYVKYYQRVTTIPNWANRGPANHPPEFSLLAVSTGVFFQAGANSRTRPLGESSTVVEHSSCSCQMEQLPCYLPIVSKGVQPCHTQSAYNIQPMCAPRDAKGVGLPWVVVANVGVHVQQMINCDCDYEAAEATTGQICFLFRKIQGDELSTPLHITITKYHILFHLFFLCCSIL